MLQYHQLGALYPHRLRRSRRLNPALARRLREIKGSARSGQNNCVSYSNSFKTVISLTRRLSLQRFVKTISETVHTRSLSQEALRPDEHSRDEAILSTSEHSLVNIKCSSVSRHYLYSYTHAILG